MEMNGPFTWDLGKGEHSRVLFLKDNVELAELVYNPKQTDKKNDSISMENLISPTVPQKPDIVLQLTKNDLHQNMKMTYLFDAKYRIDDRVNNVDTPPDDAINQMHRYRDAIYYKEQSSPKMKKEVIGGYILFPGNGDTADVQVSKFYKSIKEVNIGAFPLRPNDKMNRRLLVDFIQSLIEHSSYGLLKETIPQKGLYYSSEEPSDSNFLILTIDEDANKDVGSILQGNAETIIMCKKGLNEEKDARTIRYLVPFGIGGRLVGYYRVKEISQIPEDGKYPLRLQFVVDNWKPLDNKVKWGLSRPGFRGIIKSREDFYKYCEAHAIK
jgi:hypothetical protein